MTNDVDLNRGSSQKTLTPEHRHSSATPGAFKQIADVADILLGYLEHGKTFQADAALSIPAADYCDEKLWQNEMERLFARLPLMLALSCELPNPGSYKAMEAMGRPILLARDKNGVVRAFLNVCAHRWAPVAREGHGQCAAFTCPFHGWTYGLDGKLVGVADRAKFGQIDKEKHGLRQLPCEERHGLIFVCLRPEASIDLDSYCGPMLKEFEHLGLANWTFIGSSALEGPNWKLVLANFFESYHFAAQHPQTVAQQFVSDLIHYESAGPHMRIAFAKRSLATLRAVPRPDWDQQEGKCFTFMRYFFPNVIGSMYLSDEISSFGQILPGPTPDRSRVVVLYLRKEQPKDESDHERIQRELQKFKFATDVALRDEDLATGMAVQENLRSGAHAGLVYGRNEAGNHLFHAWVAWYLNSDPNAPEPEL